MSDFVFLIANFIDVIMRISFIFIIFLSAQIAYAQWNPNAGLIKPLSANAFIEVSSGSNKEFIRDGDVQTFWESTSQLPTNYTTRSDLNLFLDTEKYSLNTGEGSLRNAFDGITSSKSHVDAGIVEIKFDKPVQLFLLSIKLNISDTVWITVASDKKDFLFEYLPSENYSLQLIDLLNYKNISSIELKCNQSFEVFEIAGLSSLPKEEMIIDLGEVQAIGWINSRHYNGAGVKSISVSVSNNKINWNQIATLNPLVIAFIPILISPEVQAQYIKLTFVLFPKIYQKAKLLEFEVYDKFGPFGKPQPTEIAQNTYSQSFGINAIWGWGYSVYSDQLSNETGPMLFNKVALLARNYHNITWDINKPSDNPGYNNMSNGNGTSALSWLNWDREYEIWKASGFEIDACIMFNNKSFNDTLWNNTYDEALKYGAYFGSHFSKNKSLVTTVEVGNEPWEYSKDVYRSILGGMSRGLSQNSEKLTILPCAIQAYSTSLGNDNYISKYLDASNSEFLDGLNTHLYSYVYDNFVGRIALNPEDPRSEVWSVNNLHRFSNANLSGKPIYVTEFGYDSDDGSEDCIHDICISEFEQAIYGPRMALILYRLGVSQFYWYYFANVDYVSMLHNRSGLTASYSSGFQKKLSFSSFEILKESIGDFYFHHIIREDDDAYIYAFSNGNGKIMRIVGWRPTSKNHEDRLWIKFPFNDAIESVVSLVSVDGPEENISYVRGVNELKISLSGIPVVIKIKE